MRKVKNNLIKEMKQLLGNKKDLTVESLVFKESEDDYMMENEYDIELPSDEYDELPQKSMKSGIESEVKPMIDQIRKMALQGIAKLAEHPECETYSTLKKVWQLVDKATENQNKGQITDK
jgi:hypothetical protein